MLKTKTKLAEERLGIAGRMLCGSKTAYSNKHPDHAVFFNANVYDSEASKIWYGDVNLSLDRKKLKAIATELGEEIYLTKESPFRFNPPTVATLKQACDSEHPSAFCILPGDST